MIKDYAKSLGFDGLGFLKARPFFHSREGRDRYDYARGKNYLSAFLDKSDQEDLEKYKSLLILLLAYPNPLFHGPEAVRKREGYDQAYLSSSSWGRDYHFVMRKKMEKLALFIKENTDLEDYLIKVDQAPYSEREVAIKAGLGWIGKNSLLINREIGSFFFIGSIFLDIDLNLPALDLADDLCGDCTLCQEACPVGAIDAEKRVINTNLCLSEQSQSKEINYLVADKFKENKYIYGCDLCQIACPWNRKKRSFPCEFTPKEAEIIIDLEKIMQESNRSFKEKYGHLAGSWRGKKIWQRNARLIKSANFDIKNITLSQEPGNKDGDNAVHNMMEDSANTNDDSGIVKCKAKRNNN